MNNESPPSMDEIKAAIKKLKNNKASGADGIRAEVIKAGGEVVELWVARLLGVVWKQRRVPTEWLKAVIMLFFKKVISIFFGRPETFTFFKKFFKLIFQIKNLIKMDDIGRFCRF